MSDLSAYYYTIEDEFTIEAGKETNHIVVPQILLPTTTQMRKGIPNINLQYQQHIMSKFRSLMSAFSSCFALENH